MGDNSSTRIRSFSESACTGWIPGPLAEGYIAGHWRRHALRAQLRLYGQNWSPDELFRHVHLVQKTLPRYGCFDYPFNAKLDDPVLTGAYRIISQWINDTLPHLEVSRKTIGFMRDLPYNIHFSNYFDTMGQHFLLYKDMAPYVYARVSLKGMGFWKQHGFPAWLERQHPTIHSMLRNVEAGLRSRLQVWYDLDVCSQWKKMRWNSLVYETYPRRAPQYWWAWFANRPEFQSIYCNFHTDRRLAVALNLLADLDFSKENVPAGFVLEGHTPHHGCRENCPEVARLLSDEERQVLETLQRKDEEIHATGSSSTRVPITPGNSPESTEPEDENPYGPDKVIKLRYRPAVRPVITGADRKFQPCYNFPDHFNDDSSEEDFNSHQNEMSGRAQEQQIPNETSSDEKRLTPSTIDSPSDEDEDWDNSWDHAASVAFNQRESSVTFHPRGFNTEIPPLDSTPISGLRSVADRPPTPYHPDRVIPIDDRPGTPFPKPGKSSTTKTTAALHPDSARVRVVDRPSTPHPWRGKLHHRRSSSIISDLMPPLDLGSPLVPIEEPISQTPIHLVVSNEDDTDESSGDEVFEDAVEYLSSNEASPSDWHIINDNDI